MWHESNALGLGGGVAVAIGTSANISERLTARRSHPRLQLRVSGRRTSKQTLSHLPCSHVQRITGNVFPVQKRFGHFRCLFSGGISGGKTGNTENANYPHTRFSAFLRGLFEKRRKKADTAKTAETDIGNFARALERKADTPNGLFCLREPSEAGRARHDRDRRARAQAAELDNGTARSR
jgi:hypothetical protein